MNVMTDTTVREKFFPNFAIRRRGSTKQFFSFAQARSPDVENFEGEHWTVDEISTAGAVRNRCQASGHTIQLADLR